MTIYGLLIYLFESGDVQLLTYKAASACLLYGPEFVYVRKVLDCVEKDRNSSGMYSFLQKHMQSRENGGGFLDKASVFVELALKGKVFNFVATLSQRYLYKFC